MQEHANIPRELQSAVAPKKKYHSGVSRIAISECDCTLCVGLPGTLP